MIDKDALYKELLERAGGKKRSARLAVDGRCAAGKTTLGLELASAWQAGLVHMDDFFPRPEQRTPERFATPGGNVDHERFLAEVLLPLSLGMPVSYRRFNCSDFSFSDPIVVPDTPVVIIEGSYACHPALRNYYDMRIFLDVDPEVQKARIIQREGPARWPDFEQKWIPREEAYFKGCAVRECCEVVTNAA